MSNDQSSRPRPRPRPRPRAPAAPSSPLQSSSNGIPPSSPVTKPIDAEDALFIRKPRTAQEWKKLAQMEKNSKPAPTPIEISDDEDDASSPRSRKYRKKPRQERPVPNWTKKNITILLTSSSSEGEDSDKDALQSTDNTPNGKRADKTALKRKRSRSKSLTPPPALPIYRIQNARNLVRQTLDAVPRAPSPTWLGADDSIDNITLDPELAKIANEIRAAPVPAHMGGEGGGPEVVTIKVKWQPHPLDDAAKPTIWGYKMKRHDDFRQVFDETADMAGVLSNHLVVSFDGKRVFSSATPHSIRIWAEAELEACDKITHEYIRTHRHQRSLSPSHDPTNGNAMGAGSRAGTQDLSESEEETSQGEKFKLILRSAQTSKDITLTVRPTTTCGAIVKAFLKSAGLSDKYTAQTPKRGKSGDPRLCVDGEKMEPGSQIGDADLEDGDMVEVVGL